MAKQQYPQLLFEAPFDERAQYEAAARGYLSHVKVRQSDGKTYSVVFYDCTRLQQDLEYEVAVGRMCIAESGMIVVPKITLDVIQTAVKALSDEGYFNSLTPIDC
jgi:hypothetical protein